MTTAETGPEVPSASGAGAPPALSQEINTATRSVHTSLNRLITARLPLALPPHAPSPRVYALGLQHFAHVYLAFEAAWGDIVAQSSGSDTDTAAALEESWSSVSASSSSATLTPSSSSSSIADNNTNGLPDPIAATTHALLASLLPPGLTRTARLRADLAALLALPTPAAVDASLARSLASSPAAAAFVAHIRAAVAARPHVLLAYAWVMYMAVFSGGRWIRGQFLGAGEEWWRTSTTEKKAEGGEGAPKLDLAATGLAFFHFPGTHDGEDIKAAFKAQLSAAELLLTPAQRADILAEAGTIFARCEGLVHELDGLFSTLLPPAMAAEQTYDAALAAHAGAAGGEKRCPASSASAAMLQQQWQWQQQQQREKRAWRRAAGAAAGALLLGGAGWYAACAVGEALRVGWEAGWAEVGAMAAVGA
ncbi:uncharacterized protein K452DRAFT_50911 [Aplosporella prunicola CBS 121167]|uniref:Heme oxygenase-like protein n=1 Tax=Aplosporella prunicola CBS 121167 TaxID=1176127 RepID=A0A6A6B978_9PEZI|nr:uncharacterized protein K452DRAFT_50911 [Aplosporella prunicola CBS 121167]KAF2140759.1 hypothetical protein K452DRAFT_50911 [Aplosporella prunicola CBS 121167]